MPGNETQNASVAELQAELAMARAINAALSDKLNRLQGIERKYNKIQRWVANLGFRWVDPDRLRGNQGRRHAP